MNKPKKYAKGGMHKMPDGKMMKNSAMKKAMGGSVNSPIGRPNTARPVPSNPLNRGEISGGPTRVGPKPMPSNPLNRGAVSRMKKGGMANKPKGKGMAIMIAIGKSKGRGK